MRAMTLRLLLLAVAVAFATPAHADVGAGYDVPVCTGNAETDTSTLQTAFAQGGLLILPACEYVVSSTLRLKNGTHLVGAGIDATTIRSTITDGTPLIDSNPAAYLSGVRIADMSIVGPFGEGQTGMGDAFLLYAATNVSVFHNLRISNFRGNAFTFKTQTLNTGDPTTLLNADFNTVIIENVGGYAFDIAKRVHATWEDVIIDSPVMGGFRFRKGNANQSFISIRSLIAKWEQPWSSPNQVVLFDVADYQVINLEGCQMSVSTAANPTNLTFIRTNSTFYPNLMDCTATGVPFKYWVADTKNPQNNKPYASWINLRF